MSMQMRVGSQLLGQCRACFTPSVSSPVQQRAQRTEVPDQMYRPTSLQEARRVPTRPRTPRYISQHDDSYRLVR